MLSELLKIKNSESDPVIFRENQRNYGWIGINNNSDIIGKPKVTNHAFLKGLFAQMRQGVFNKIKKFCQDNSIEFSYEDQFSRFRRNSRELLIALFLSIFLEYVILVASFNSFVKPLIVIGMIPLSLGGILLILLISGSSLNINSFMSIIVLIGLLVNNAIMLFLEYGRRSIKTEKDIIAASIYRLKPIMITTLSTILALIPGLFTSNRIQISLSLTLILGLLYSTAITLMFLPLFYRLLFMRDQKNRII